MIPPEVPFTGFPKIARLNRLVVVTEKIDGTNAQIYITDDGRILAGSRNKWITPEDDNYGFAKWVHAHAAELAALGPGAHFGEWWGAGIQRRYGMTEKVFSLFNVGRWNEKNPPPACCRTVPELFRGSLENLNIGGVMADLQETGSIAAPGFMNPEGIILFHTASGQLFKKTIKDDASPKSAVEVSP